VNVMRTLLFLPIAATLVLTSSQIGVATEDELSYDVDEGSYDVESEIDWARSTWPQAFEDVHCYSPVAKLMAWVPNGQTIRVYAYSPDHNCRLVELARDSDADSNPSAATRLTGKTGFRFENDAGRNTRTFGTVLLGREFVNQRCCFWEEERGPDGRWHESMSSATPDVGEVYGVLSYADKRVALFGGEPMFINGTCDGPFDWISCAGGGERPCNRCEEIGVMLTEGARLFADLPNFGGRRVTCNDRCPNYPDSPVRARLHALERHVSVWRPRGEPIAKTPSLYKSLKDCRRDHSSR
jgi:hypothetical protein